MNKIFVFLCIFWLAGCASLNLVKDRLPPPSPVAGSGEILFQYDFPSARTVSVAGEFNGWEWQSSQPRAIFLKKNEKGIWQAKVKIAPGRYQYKIVLDYQTWILDPYNPYTIDDGRGNINSLLVVK